MDGLFSLSLSRFLIERANIFFRPLELASNLPRSVGRSIDRLIGNEAITSNVVVQWILRGGLLTNQELSANTRVSMVANGMRASSTRMVVVNGKGRIALRPRSVA